MKNRLSYFRLWKNPSQFSIQFFIRCLGVVFWFFHRPIFQSVVESDLATGPAPPMSFALLGRSVRKVVRDIYPLCFRGRVGSRLVCSGLLLDSLLALIQGPLATLWPPLPLLGCTQRLRLLARLPAQIYLWACLLKDTKIHRKSPVDFSHGTCWAGDDVTIPVRSHCVPRCTPL